LASVQAEAKKAGVNITGLTLDQAWAKINAAKVNK